MTTLLATDAERIRDGDLDSILDGLGNTMECLSGRRLLITGGAGFLGYYLVQTPLRWNDRNPSSLPIRVVASDNYQRGVPQWLKSLGHRPDLEIRPHDVRYPVPDDLGQVNFIVHAAGIASPTYYRQHPLETMDANVTGLRMLLDYSVRNSTGGGGIEGFLFFSSSEIYGDPTPDAIPTPETYRGNVSCTGPRACYDESKRYGETLCVTFASQFGVPVSMARPFNNYGPGMKITDGRVIADLFRHALAGEDLVLLSDGSPTRTFCYVGDAVVGYYQVLLMGRPGEPYNIGVEAPEVSMKDLANRIAVTARDVMGYDGDVVFGRSLEANYLVDNPNRRCPNITRARSELGFSPRVDLDDGLRRTLVWYLGNPGGENR